MNDHIHIETNQYIDLDDYFNDSLVTHQWSASIHFDAKFSKPIVISFDEQEEMISRFKEWNQRYEPHRSRRNYLQKIIEVSRHYAVFVAQPTRIVGYNVDLIGRNIADNFHLTRSAISSIRENSFFVRSI